MLIRLAAAMAAVAALLTLTPNPEPASAAVQAGSIIRGGGADCRLRPYRYIRIWSGSPAHGQVVVCLEPNEAQERLRAYVWPRLEAAL